MSIPMSKKTTKCYRVEDENGLGIVVDIDHAIVTDAALHEINNFWSGAKIRLTVANGDILLCVLRLLWRSVMYLTMETHSVREQFNGNEVEGWPRMNGTQGWGLVNYDIPAFDPDNVTHTDITPEATA